MTDDVAYWRERAEKAERELAETVTGLEQQSHESRDGRKLNWWSHFILETRAHKATKKELLAAQSEVTRLTADLAARTKERDDLSAQVYVPGQWVCAKCKFTLQQMVMSAVDGSVTAQDKPGEPCPNCASPLWRTTWKQEASEMQERAIEQMERERDEARKHAANTRIRERVEGDNLRSRIDQEAARADALQQRVDELELWYGLTLEAQVERDSAREERDALQQRVGALEAAIAWACGYMVGEPFRERRDGEGAFYWRNELRERSGMVKADFLAAEKFI